MRLTFATLMALAASPALAQTAGEAPSDPPGERDFVQIGLGAAINGDYEGSDDYRVIPGGVLRARVSGITIQTEGLGISADLIDRLGKLDLDLGPVVRLGLNRTGKIKDDLVDLLPERDVAVEVGGFAGVTVRRITNPYDSLSFRLQAVKDVAGAHDSLVLTPSATFATPLSQATLATVSASADVVTGRYARYYFGVTPAESLASGLRAYSPGGGMKNVRATLLVAHSLSGDLRRGGWGLFGIASHNRLLGDFKRSPLVADRGTRGQWFGAAGVGYSW